MVTSPRIRRCGNREQSKTETADDDMHQVRRSGADNDVENRHRKEQHAGEKRAKRNTKLKHSRL